MSSKDCRSQTTTRMPHGAGLLTFLAVIVSLGAPSFASASSNFYWYGENDSTCWQTGLPGSSSSACDSVGAGYLNTQSHRVEGGISAQIALSTSGDYCGYYGLGDSLSSQESSNQRVNTGYETPTPYGEYQETDGHQNVCQAYGSHWGQEILDTAPNNKCSETCGMNHYVSFASQSTNDRPWSSWFGSPTFVVSAEADPQGLKRIGSGTNFGAWGYLCPLFKDTTTGNVLEYCMEEWRSKYNTSEWAQEGVGTCASSGNTNIDLLRLLFASGTRFATKYSGSSETYVAEASGARHFEAGITAANLENAIKTDNEVCKRSSSTNPGNYALIGVEQGLEGWRELAFVGGSTANLQLRTEYTPPQSYPLTVFYAGSGDTLQENWWTGSLWGYININSPMGAGSSPAADQFPNPGQLDVYFRGSNGELQEDYYGGESGWHLINLGHGMAAGTTPTIRHPQVGGSTVLYYTGSSGTLQESWWTGEAWGYYNIGVPIAAGSSPAADPHPNPGQDDVYFRGSNGELQEEYYGGESGWHWIGLGHGMAAGTTPVVVHPQVGGETYVFYAGSNGILQESWWTGSKWEWTSLGATVEGGTSPAGL